MKNTETMTKSNSDCEACLCKMLRLTGHASSDPAWAKNSLDAGEDPGEIMKRVFYAKVRQMDFHFSMAFNDAMNKAGRPFEGHVETFLEAESSGLRGLTALEAEPRRVMKVINRTA